MRCGRAATTAKTRARECWTAAAAAAVTAALLLLAAEHCTLSPTPCSVRFISIAAQRFLAQVCSTGALAAQPASA